MKNFHIGFPIHKKDKKSDAYYVDEGLAQKFKSIFEIPGKDEIDVWVEQ